MVCHILDGGVRMISKQNLDKQYPLAFNSEKKRRPLKRILLVNICIILNQQFRHFNKISPNCPMQGCKTHFIVVINKQFIIIIMLTINYQMRSAQTIFLSILLQFNLIIIISIPQYFPDFSQIIIFYHLYKLSRTLPFKRFCWNYLESPNFCLRQFELFHDLHSSFH